MYSTQHCMHNILLYVCSFVIHWHLNISICSAGSALMKVVSGLVTVSQPCRCSWTVFWWRQVQTIRSWRKSVEVCFWPFNLSHTHCVLIMSYLLQKNRFLWALKTCSFKRYTREERLINKTLKLMLLVSENQ